MTALPRYGLLVEYDLNGSVIKSWHDPTGKVLQAISHAEIKDGKVYLGSIFDSYVAVIDY
jgi:hypothetical protein